MYKRSRLLYGFIILITILLGLASREFSNVLPWWIGIYSGDMLWALMIFLMGGFIFNNLGTLRVGLIGLTFSIIIEISQLYQSSWINNIRKTRIGGLVLGFGFLWSDLACYLVGIGIGILIEKLIIRNVVINNQ